MSTNCEGIDRCVCLRRYVSTELLALLEETYCHRNPDQCRRRQLHDQGARPPDNMLPNGEILPTHGAAADEQAA